MPTRSSCCPRSSTNSSRKGELAVRAQEAPGPWFGLTYQDDKAEVMSGLVDLTARGVYPPSLWR